MFDILCVLPLLLTVEDSFEKYLDRTVFLFLQISKDTQHSHTNFHKIEVDNGDVTEDKATLFFLLLDVGANFFDEAGLVHNFLV